jgi:hypothetical protein
MKIEKIAAILVIMWTIVGFAVLVVDQFYLNKICLGC